MLQAGRGPAVGGGGITLTLPVLEYSQRNINTPDGGMNKEFGHDLISQNKTVASHAELQD